MCTSGLPARMSVPYVHACVVGIKPVVSNMLQSITLIAQSWSMRLLAGVNFTLVPRKWPFHVSKHVWGLVSLQMCESSFRCSLTQSFNGWLKQNTRGSELRTGAEHSNSKALLVLPSPSRDGQLSCRQCNRVCWQQRPRKVG